MIYTYFFFWKWAHWWSHRHRLDRFRFKNFQSSGPAPWRQCFLTNPNGLNNLGRGSPKEHSCQIILQLFHWFLTRRFFKFSIWYIGKINPAPWQPCFLMNPNGSNNLGRGSPKEHFCKIIWKSVQWFLTRRFFWSFLYRYIGKISLAPLAAMFFDKSKWLEQSW